jgi:uncharacterized membrane protein
MQHPVNRSIRTYWLWYAILLAGVVAFVVSPGGFAEKSRAVLHGLCAQTPTHSFSFGGLLLPFDGRMTGIYGGTLFTLAYLAVRGRLFAWGNPPIRIVVTLLAFVAVMAVDGFNSLLLDLGLWHPYEPHNLLRLITGFATGISLAAVLAWLLGSSVYRVGRNEAGIQGSRDLSWIWLAIIPYAALVVSGASWLYIPLSVTLMLSAWLTLALLALVIVILLLRLDEQVDRTETLHVPGAVAAVAGLVMLLSLSSGRMWLESAFGIAATH